jgi:hypothetical protein
VTLELQRLNKVTGLQESFYVFGGYQNLEGLLTEIPKMITSKVWGRRMMKGERNQPHLISDPENDV